MNVSEVRPPRDGFEGRLEAELVKVVTARATARRRWPAAVRRPAVRGAVAAGLAAAVAGGVVSGLSSGSPAGAGPGTAAGPVHIHTAAFTVHRNADGTIRVTWEKSQYFRDRQGLQQALRAAGFPVLIKEGVFCKGPQDNGNLDASGQGAGVSAVMNGEQQADGTVVFVFTPSAMPRGEELFIGYLSPAQLAVTQGHPGSVERLVPTGVALTCTTQPPPPGSARSAATGLGNRSGRG
jgi:hypothetical protein